MLPRDNDHPFKFRHVPPDVRGNLLQLFSERTKLINGYTLKNHAEVASDSIRVFYDSPKDGRAGRIRLLYGELELAAVLRPGTKAHLPATILTPWLLAYVPASDIEKILWRFRKPSSPRRRASS